MSNNYVTLNGVVETEPLYHHSSKHINFYRTTLLVEDTGLKTNSVPINVKEEDLPKFYKGANVAVYGRLRTFNVVQETYMRVDLSVNILGFLDYERTYNNHAVVQGKICKGPLFRIKPNGTHKVDLVIAISRPYGKSDYVSCVAFGDLADRFSKMTAGDDVTVFGKVTSREYKKYLGSGVVIPRTTYELFIEEFQGDK